MLNLLKISGGDRYNNWLYLCIFKSCGRFGRIVLMYFGSVQFFKHLIVTVVLLLIFGLTISNHKPCGLSIRAIRSIFLPGGQNYGRNHVLGSPTLWK
jgi:hypothetical protein